MIEDTGIVDCCFILVECLCRKETRQRRFLNALLVALPCHGCGDTRLQ